MEIRIAKTEDITRINELLKQINLVHYNGRPDIFKIGNKYNDEELENLITDKNRLILVAVKDFIVVGYIMCIYKEIKNNSIIKDSKELYIDDFCVDENFRGQKIGEEIYKKVVEIAKENNFNRITLDVWALNERAKAFYERLGLIPLKTVMEMKI